MQQIIYIFALISFLSDCECEFEPFIVGGKKAKITQFPHSAFLKIVCVDLASGMTIPWICGASILNQNMILTAAHCLEGCNVNSDIIIVVGHENRDRGAVSSMHSYMLHEDYDSFGTANDIALVKLTTTLTFDKNVKRIAVMKYPPYREKAQIAGWGMNNEDTNQQGNVLVYIDQYVLNKRQCLKILTKKPVGTICASSRNSESYASRGDSGSALVVRGYIQIGIVSYKMPKLSRSLVVYTDTGYFYNWIRKNSRRLYCV